MPASNNPNPYASPLAQSATSAGRPGGSQYAPCPDCGERNAKKISFTWWGGAVGPALFTHVKCLSCGAKYNGKTGRSNLTAIVIYQVVAVAIVIVIGIALVIAKR
jgi:hypothetical protein